MGGFRVTLLNDKFKGKFSSPVAKTIISQLDAIMKTFPQSKLDIYLTIATIAMEAYNEGIASWEPVIEPWNLGEVISLCFQYLIVF